MQVFQIRGFSGVVILLLAVLAVILVFMLLPATFMMVLWNALVFESLKGPEVDLYQGFLLWGVMAVMIKLVFKPEIQLQFVRPSSPAKKGGGSSENTLKSEAAPEEEIAPAKLDKQN